MLILLCVAGAAARSNKRVGETFEDWRSSTYLRLGFWTRVQQAEIQISEGSGEREVQREEQQINRQPGSACQLPASGGYAQQCRERATVWCETWSTHEPHSVQSPGPVSSLASERWENTERGILGGKCGEWKPWDELRVSNLARSCDWLFSACISPLLPSVPAGGARATVWANKWSDSAKRLPWPGKLVRSFREDSVTLVLLMYRWILKEMMDW